MNGCRKALKLNEAIDNDILSKRVENLEIKIKKLESKKKTKTKQVKKS